MLTHRFRQLSLPAAVSRSHVSSTTTPLAPVTPAARPRVLDLQRHRAERAEVMRLLVSSSDLGGGWRGFDVGGRDDGVEVGAELAGDVALEAADDLLFGASLGGAAGDVVLGGLV